MREYEKIITVDGPSGSGKGALALALSDRLGWQYLDSGMLYRAYAWWCYSEKLEINALKQDDFVDAKLDFVCLSDKKIAIQYQGEWLEEALIRDERCAKKASDLAKLKAFRDFLLPKQRSFYQVQKGLICDGRDMGSVVFPKASLKIFLNASLKVRAERRYEQLKLSHQDVTLPQVIEDLTNRDDQDIKREFAPLLVPTDAIVLDNTHLSIEQTVEKVIAHLTI